jgi:hypothetical protein
VCANSAKTQISPAAALTFTNSISLHVWVKTIRGSRRLLLFGILTSLSLALCLLWLNALVVSSLMTNVGQGTPRNPYH